MNESRQGEAPDLGRPTDSDAGADAMSAAETREDVPVPGSDAPAGGRTMDTPDELGGTGGEQSGGAG